MNAPREAARAGRASVADLQRLAALLDEALDLDEDARRRWLDALPADVADLRPQLQQLFEARPRDETGDRLDPGLVLAALADAPAGSGDEPFAAGQAIGPYRLLRPLGAGGMGEVWLAERGDDGPRRTVALKLPFAQARRGRLAQRFRREAEILAALEHPNIARLYDARAAADGQPYLALEVVDGEPITRHCDAHGLGLRARVALLRQVMDAVQYAHAHLVVHRDLKPSNVLVRADGRAMLLDFGIAKLLADERDAAPATELTRLGGRALTPRYAAPEQLGGAAVSTATDVWALGVLLYELAAGHAPFDGETAHAVERAVLDADPARLAGLRSAPAAALGRGLVADLDTIVAKALRKAPAERYPTVAAFADDLDRWLRGEPVLARPHSAGYRLRKFVARHRAGVALGGAAVLALVLGAAVSLWQAGVARAEAQRALAVQAFVVDLFRANSADQPDPQRARSTTARELLDQGAALLGTALADQPHARLALLETLAQLYAELALWPEASRLTAQRLALARQVYGGADERLAAALIDHARALDARMRDSAAEVLPLIDEAGRVLAAAGATDGLLQARAHVLAADHLIDSAPALARSRAEQGVALYRRLPDMRPGLDDALESLALALMRSGDWAGAVRAADEALQVARDRGRADVHLARLLRRAGEIRWFAGADGAEPLLRRALALAEHVHGEHGPGTVSIRLSLARYLADGGRPAEGRGLADRALDDAQRPAAGSGEPFQVQEVRRLVLEIYLAQGDHAAARALVAEGFADLGPTPPDSFLHADLLFALADVQIAEGRFDAAQHSLAKAAAIARRLGLGGQSRLVQNLAVLDARLLLARGDSPAALQRLQAMQVAAGPGAAEARPRGLHARALAEAGRLADAGAFVDAALREIEAAPERQRHADDEAQLLLVRAGLRQSDGGCAAALAALEQAVELHRRLFVPGSPRRAAAEAALARCRGAGAPAGGLRVAGAER